jgi:hypothetical protein
VNCVTDTAHLRTSEISSSRIAPVDVRRIISTRRSRAFC